MLKIYKSLKVEVKMKIFQILREFSYQKIPKNTTSSYYRLKHVIIYKL